MLYYLCMQLSFSTFPPLCIVYIIHNTGSDKTEKKNKGKRDKAICLKFKILNKVIAMNDGCDDDDVDDGDDLGSGHGE